MSQDTIWHQRDGTPIRVGDMEDSHLINTRNMLLRKFDKAKPRLQQRWERFINIFDDELLRRSR